MVTNKKLVILDRDGVINEDSDAYIKSPDEWQPIPNSLEAIAQLNHAGYRVVVATNQSGLNRGLFDMATLNAIHLKMHRAASKVNAKIDAIFFCPHIDEDNCECRKPKPGLIRQIIDRYGVAPEQLPVVGDANRDLKAASAANCMPFLVLTGKGQYTLSTNSLPPNTKVFDNLQAFTTYFLHQENN